MVKGIPAAPAKLLEKLRESAVSPKHLRMSQCCCRILSGMFNAFIRIRTICNGRCQCIHRGHPMFIGRQTDQNPAFRSLQIPAIHLAAHRQDAYIMIRILQKNHLGARGDIPKAFRKGRSCPPAFVLINRKNPLAFRKRKLCTDSLLRINGELCLKFRLCLRGLPLHIQKAAILLFLHLDTQLQFFLLGKSEFVLKFPLIMICDRFCCK